MSEPTQFFAGDTVEWDKTLAAEYPSSAWVLTYSLINTGTKIPITAAAAANGIDYEVRLLASVTDTYIPGDYSWVAKVTDIATGLEIHTVGVGQMRVLINLDDVNTHDGRSWATIALANVEAVIAKRATVDQEAYSIQGRSLSRTPLADLINLRKYLQAEVQTEEALLNPDAPSQKRAQVRF